MTAQNHHQDLDALERKVDRLIVHCMKLASRVEADGKSVNLVAEHVDRIAFRLDDIETRLERLERRFALFEKQ